jgi:hypothetical protein
MKDLSGYIDSLLDGLTSREQDIVYRVYLKDGIYVIDFIFYGFSSGNEAFITQIVEEQVDKVIDRYLPKGSIEYLIVVNTAPLQTQKEL